jgi:HAD superfamily hydrolase (TIGR01509 family)
MPRLEAVLFDFGGTLDGDGVHWRERFHAIYARTGHPIEAQRFTGAFATAERTLARQHDLREASFREMIELQVRLQMEALQIDNPGLARRVVQTALEEAADCLARSRRALQRLHSDGLQLGIVSNFPGNLRRVCREAGLDSFLGPIVDSTRVGVSKPDPAIFQIALATLGVEPGACAFVGDSIERDLLPARRLAMTTVWLAPPGPVPAHPVEADLVLQGIEQLAELPARLRACQPPPVAGEGPCQ